MANPLNTIKVKNDDEGIRLDRWFKRHYKHVPFGLVAKMIRKGVIKLNSKKSEISKTVHAGDEIKFPNFDIAAAPTQRKSNPELERIIIDSIIYKDKNIIVLNKPSGLAVQGGSKIAYSVDDLSECLRFESDERPKLVHRIDKDTSGILVMARKASVASKLSEIFRLRNMKKFYIAVLQGVPKPHKGKIDFPIMKEEQDGYEKVRRHNDKGQRSLTFYQVLDFTANKFSLVQFELVTGRTHQLRIHSSLIECPILGDDKYGSRDMDMPNVSDKLHLHSYKMEFEFEGKILKFKAEIPRHFRETLNTLGLSVTN
jgi:23S rRNA pseudouridine955/2504/2580 synthase